MVNSREEREILAAEIYDDFSVVVQDLLKVEGIRNYIASRAMPGEEEKILLTASAKYFKQAGNLLLEKHEYVGAQKLLSCYGEITGNDMKELLEKIAVKGFDYYIAEGDKQVAAQEFDAGLSCYRKVGELNSNDQNNHKRWNEAVAKKIAWIKTKRREADEKLQQAGFRYLRTRTYSCGGKTHTVKEYRHEKTGLEFVLIPGGSFRMGSTDGGNDEKPVHEVELSSFLLAKTEVTQGVWRRIMGDNPSRFKKGDNHPVEQVSWEDCQKFCRKTGLRLPTEAQWEYACRGGTNTNYYWGNDIDGDYCWYSGNSGGNTHAVGGKKANAYGLYDMSGNVWEWCADWYDSAYYSKSPRKNPENTRKSSNRVNRGGSWGNDADYCRSAIRSISAPGFRNYNLGFRVASPVP